MVVTMSESYYKKVVFYRKDTEGRQVFLVDKDTDNVIRNPVHNGTQREQGLFITD